MAMFYRIENKTDNEVGNVFPQVHCVSHDLTSGLRSNNFVNLDDELFFQLKPMAKLTDVLSQASISSYGLLINEKTKKSIKEFNIMNHRFYKCKVLDDSGIYHSYYWLQIYDSETVEKINYKKSKFYFLEYGFRDGEVLLESFNDYKKLKKANGKMWDVGADFIEFCEPAMYELDLFCIPTFKNKLFASEKLHAVLNSMKTTGISLTKTSEIR